MGTCSALEATGVANDNINMVTATAVTTGCGDNMSPRRHGSLRFEVVLCRCLRAVIMGSRAVVERHDWCTGVIILGGVTQPFQAFG